MKKDITLYLNSSTDFSIKDERGLPYTIEGAKQVVNDGRLKDCNIAFQRLITLDFDLEAVKAFYIALDEAQP